MNPIIPILLLMTTTAMAQTTTNPKDLWTRSINVKMDSTWRTKTLRVEGRRTPNVIDFFRAFAKAYPCDYHRLLLMAIDGDQEVLFNHSKPDIRIDRDTCMLENESFAMRVFYQGNKPAAVGIVCHKALSTEVQDAYYYTYDAAKRTLTPMAQGSDFTGGIVKRATEFIDDKSSNKVIMHHRWGRCGMESRLVWKNGRFTLEDPLPSTLKAGEGETPVMQLLCQVLRRHNMEPRYPQPESNEPGGSILSLPICVALLDKQSTPTYAAAEAMEGFYYFHAKAWPLADGKQLMALYTECARMNDYDFHSGEEMTRVPHKLTTGDEVTLCFYLYDGAQTFTCLSPDSPQYAQLVGGSLPSLAANKWRCQLSSDTDALVFISEDNGQKQTYRWSGNALTAE